jgi:hypothetical protein
VRAGGKEFAQPLGRTRNRIGPRDADGVKALRARRGDERRLERCGF